MTLSAGVSNIVSVLSVSETVDARCLGDDGLLRLDYVGALLPADHEQCASYEAAVTALGPVFAATRRFVESISSDEYSARFLRAIGWTSSPELVDRCFRLVKLADDSSLRLSLLMLTTCTERSLGDVYWHASGGAACPPLLKDIVAAPLLADAIGCTSLRLLRTLFGSPTSINLRNLVWHGFGAPGELPELQYASFLLVLLPTIGTTAPALTAAPNGGLAAMQHRPFLRLDYVSACLRRCSALPAIALGARSSVCRRPLLSHFDLSFFPASTQPYVVGALGLYEHGRWGEFAVLLLPQLEHAFRCLFCSANDCPRRMQTAESAEYFTTWDAILRPVVVGGAGDGQPNELRRLLSSGDLAMLYDLLVLPAGPRLRDYLGHMEIKTASVDEAIASYVLLIASELSCRLASTTSDHQPGHSLARCELGDRFEYEPLFHPAVMVKEKVVEAVALLGGCDEQPATAVPDRLLGTDLPSTSGDLLALSWWLLEHECREYPTDCSTRLRDWVRGGAVDVASMSCVPSMAGALGRDKEVNALAWWDEVVQHRTSCSPLLLQTASRTRQAIDNMVRFDTARKEQSCNGTLRSRQRANYLAFRTWLPSLIVLAKVCLAVIVNQLHYAMTAKGCQQVHVKRVLQIAQNLETHTGEDSNRWADCAAVCSRLINKLLLSKPTERDVNRADAPGRQRGFGGRLEHVQRHSEELLDEVPEAAP